MKNGLLSAILLWGCWLAVLGQPQRHTTTTYDEEDGLPHGHVTQLLQDDLGFIWLATWNGLCRYDGYEFRTFKSRAGDGCQMVTDRFRDIALRPDGQIVCRVDDGIFAFDPRTCRFSNLTGDELRQATDDLKRYRQSRAARDEAGLTTFTMTDRQGVSWTATSKGLVKQTTTVQHTSRLDLRPQGEVKCLLTDSRGRCWLSTKEDATVRVYAPGLSRLEGYLGKDGRLHNAYTSFGDPVYCMYETADGDLWLGCKPGGLYRLRTAAGGGLTVTHITELPGTAVYSLVADGQGRLWVGTLDGGLCYTADARADRPRFTVPKGYPAKEGQRLRRLYLTRQGDMLLAAATDGLLVARLERQADDMVFRCYRREPSRRASLSSSAVADMTEDGQGHLYLGTESGGVNRTETSGLLMGQPVFSHYTADNHGLPNDVVVAMAALDRDRTMVVGRHLITLLDTAGVERVLDARFFGGDYRFSDARPQPLGGGRWLFGLTDGAFVTSEGEMMQPAYRPRVVLTGISIQGGADDWAVAAVDTLTLQPRERSVTIQFAALDYQAPDRISYAFRLLPNDRWNNIGHTRSATLLDLKPGCYGLEIRCTDADGVWLDDVRRLTIVVKPTFWESTWGRLLMVLLTTLAVAVIAYTILYIRRIKRSQRETLEAYLALLNAGDGPAATPAEQEPQPATTHVKPEDDAMMKRIMAFIEQNIGNSDASVGDMAMAAATSRSGLQRKLKQAMGVTPQDLLREARIKRACQLLRETDRTVADVAYACGFTDPKYFSRCFKQSTGLSPTDYKSR